MSRLILVRHGETVWHKENRYAGRSDVALTEKGMRQAAELGVWARGAGLTSVWSSPLSRARFTAEPAAEAAGVTLQIDPGLIEVDFGRAEGMTSAEMEAAFPEARRAFERAPATHGLPGAEAADVAALRGVESLYAIAALDRGTTLVVAHNTLLRLVLCKLLGMPFNRYRDVFPVLKNAAGTEIELGPKGAALLGLNVPLTNLGQR